MAAFCGVCGELFQRLNMWLGEEYGTFQEIVFPYGNKYGWGVAHRIKNKLICNILAENGSFTVMMRMTDAQFASVYDTVSDYARGFIDNKYPCGGGGWIHYSVSCAEHLHDAELLLKMRISG